MPILIEEIRIIHDDAATLNQQQVVSVRFRVPMIRHRQVDAAGTLVAEGKLTVEDLIVALMPHLERDQVKRILAAAVAQRLDS